MTMEALSTSRVYVDWEGASDLFVSPDETLSSLVVYGFLRLPASLARSFHNYLARFHYVQKFP